MTPFPRLRQACVAAKSDNRRSIDDSQLRELDLEQALNRAVISGVMVDEPQRYRSRDGAPITVLLISFAAPDERVSSGSALCEVEILDELADRHRRQLRLGATVLIVGELMGAGGLWANSLTARSPT